MQQTKDNLWMDCTYRLFANQPCVIQPRLEELFNWHRTDEGELVMPTLGEKTEPVRVNFCPVCGAKIRYLKIENNTTP